MSTPAQSPDDQLAAIMRVVSNGVIAQAASHGISHVPDALAREAMLLSLNKIRTMPRADLHNLSLAGEVGQAIRTSFDAALSELPPTKREALLKGEKVRTDEDARLASTGGFVQGRWMLAADMNGANLKSMYGRDNGNAPASYRDLPGSQNSYGPEKYTYTQMNSLASSLGVAWAMNQQDLLKLGPGALRDIAESGFKRDSYGLLSKDVGLNAKEIVGVAKLAKAKHFNTDTFTKEAEPIIKGDSENRADEQDTWRKISKWGYHPDDPKCEQDVEDKFEKMKQRHPEHAGRIDGLADRLHVHVKKHEGAKVAAGAKDANADHKVAVGETKVAKASDGKQQYAAARAASPSAGL